MKEEIRVNLLDSNIITNNKRHKLDDDYNNADEDAIVDTLSITPTLLLSTFFTLLGSLSFGFAVGYPSPVQSQIIKELGLSTSEYSLFVSINNIGSAVGALLCGKLADYLGRRRALGLADIFYVLGWFSIAISQDAWSLDLGRLMVGVAMSICSFVVPVYIAEFTPKNLRGGFVILHVLMVTTGASLVFLLGLIISWPTLALIGIIPSLVQIVSVFFIPESPRWLMMIGKIKEFEAAVRQFRGAKIDISQEVFDIKVCAEALQEKPNVGILQLFQKKYAYTLTVGIGLTAFPMLVGINGIVAYSRSIFESAGLSGVTGMVALSVTQLPSVVLGIFLTDKCGRRPLMMISSAGVCLGCLLTALAFTSQDHRFLDGFSPYIALIGILVYFATYPVGIGGVSSVIVSEIFPLNIKGVAGSLSTLIGALTGWLVSYTLNFSLEWSSSGTFYILAGICAMTLIFVAKLVPETKGKTLEEVHLQMNNVWQ
ncbi:hypothetical protein RND81_09G223700 [Saponaria officinalis]|uniref:Major facilitator superfamily (MFS) profile domain-containing protein n=1 Tax=Saponaria officinalis TaxID=3572 RepID=A0AAW1IR54_SAPOF